MKRAFDIVAALLGLVLFFPALIVAGLLIKLDSNGPIFFRQERVGKGFRPFFIFKLRTMTENSRSKTGLLTIGKDPRITRVGRFLRKMKIDELPQLINVLQGDMTFVGPRPEVPEFVKLFRTDYEEILTVRPGITDLASLKYRDEATLLGDLTDPTEEYIRRILPDKIRLAKKYIEKSSVSFDVKLILKTLLKVFDGRIHNVIER